MGPYSMKHLIVTALAALAVVAPPASAKDYCYENVDTELPITGSTYSKADLNERYALSKTLPQNNNSVCYGRVRIVDYANGQLIEAYRPDALTCGHDQLFVPIFPAEIMWNNTFRTILYGVAMAYCFLGVAIIADRFMVAIEVITSKEKTLHIKNENGELEAVKVQVWNATMANLTLMALGSSAPEIMLAVIEAISTKDDVPVEGLGPSCIVGSAAFNLLAISAICVMAIPDGDVRRIADLGVFNITAFFSVFAYVWMYLVLGVITPNVVDLWEALVTLGFFPLLAAVAFCQDKNWIWCRTKAYKIAQSPDDKQSDMGQKIHLAGDGVTTGHYMNSMINTTADHSMFRDALNKRAEELGVPVSEVDIDEVAEIVAAEIEAKKPKSRMHYRINATRKLASAPRVGKPKALTKHTAAETKRHDDAASKTMQEKLAMANGNSVLSWESTKYSVFENEQFVTLNITRSGDLSKEVTIMYETSSGTAMAGVDFTHAQGTARIAAGQERSSIKVGIIDDNEYEPDESFYCRLYNPSEGSVIGIYPITEVTIVNDDDPGQFSFSKGTYIVNEVSEKATVEIQRKNGCDGNVSVRYYTVSAVTSKAADGTISSGEAAAPAEAQGPDIENPQVGKKSATQEGEGIAVPGQDYETVSGVITFAHQETLKTFDIPIKNNHSYKKDKSFSIAMEILEYPHCGATYGDQRDCMVKIAHDEEMTAAVDKVAVLLSNNLDRLRLGTDTWRKQFSDAVTLYSEDGEEPACMDFFMHFLTFGWKVIFALVPPTHYAGGWLTFVVSLIFIGVLTGIVGDIAGTFGCLIGLSAPVTAITFVALGTSLPDTFASKQAAEESETADASIGNVTGSNSVNVFLGLGLPWTILAFYKSSQGLTYEVKAGGLAFSVIVFCVCAVICICVFYIRRFYFGGELGGPRGMKRFSAGLFAMLWLIYVVLSSLRSEGIM